VTSLTIPHSVTNIEDFAFAWCTNLKELYFEGNAPNLGGASVFRNDSNATIYNLPGTFGWGSTLGGVPVVLWNPSMSTSPTNRFGFSITGTTNIPTVLEASATLPTGGWTLLVSCTLTNGSIYFNDPEWTNYSSRFYRIRSP